jgi:SpoIID/LytB domain protein
MRRSLLSGLALVAALSALAGPRPATASVAVLVIDGKGWGHGVGMAQEGAFWMAAAGSTTEQILGQFYPGAGIGRGRGPVRVPVLDAGAAPASVVVALPNGGELREIGSGPGSPGFPVRVAAGASVRIVFDGARYRVEGAAGGGGPVAAGRLRCPSGRHDGDRKGCTTTRRATSTRTMALGRPTLVAATHGQVPTLPPPPTGPTTTTTSTTEAPPPTSELPPPTTATTTPRSSSTSTTAPRGDEPPPPTTPPPPPGPSSVRPLAAIPVDGGTVAVPDRQRRYRGYVEATAASGTLRLVNTVDVETYLKGMGEVLDPAWPPAALRAQAIAARTYALRAMAGGEVCDTQRCQVYLGAQAEYAAMNTAVDDSRERVLVFDRALISAVYSANGGGHSASREEGFGVVDGGVPYLRSAPYLTKDPGPWTVRVALTDVAARLGYSGELTDVRVSRAGPSGRAIEVVLDGSAGPKAVPGLAFDAALGLRSTLFSLRIEAGEAPPPPPLDAEVAVQVAPEQAADIAATETAGAPTTLPPVVGTTGVTGADGDIPDELLVLASWMVTALVCAVFILAPMAIERRRSPAPRA